MPRRPSLLACVCLAATGCASLAAPGPDPLPVLTDPPGAQVYLDGRAAGVTPTIVSLDRRQAGVVRLEAPGYEPATVDLDRVFNGWFIGNLACAGGLGMLVDVAQHNVTRYPDDVLEVELQATGPGGAVSEPAVVTLREARTGDPVPRLRDARESGMLGLAAGAGFPDFLWLQGGPVLGPVSLDLRLGAGLFDLYLGGGFTIYAPLTEGGRIPAHALAVAGRYMVNLDPAPPPDTGDGDDWDFDFELHGPDSTAALQVGWIGTNRIGLQGRAMVGACSFDGELRPSLDLGIGWVF